MQFNLKVGDKAVYPGHGVGKVTSVEEKTVMGSNLTFYSLEMIESGDKILVPKNRMSTVGVRPVIGKQEAKKVMNILIGKEVKSKKAAEKNWQKRHQSYIDKIKTGSIYEIAEVINDLSSISKEKELSYGEKKIMDRARGMVMSELSLTVDKKDLIDCLPPIS